MCSNFRSDLRAEAEVGAYLMENLWNALSGERVTDLGMQKAGVDVVITGSDGQPVHIDEKIKCKRSISEPMFPYTSVEVLQDADRT